MAVTIVGLLAVIALALPIARSVHRRHVRVRTVRRVRASLACWLTSDMAAPLRPVVTSPTVATGATPQGPGVTPDLLVPAVRRRFSFALTPYEIEHHRRVS